MTSHCLRLSALLLFVMSANLTAAEIKGTVVGIQAESVSLKLDSDLLPNVGDKVEIYIELPGLDDVALVASGKVSKADDNPVLVKIDEATGKIEKAQLARISSAKPRKRSVSTPASPLQTPAETTDEPAFLLEGSALLGEQDERVSSIGVLSDGRRAISAAHDTKLIRFWDLRTGKELRQISFSDADNVETVSFAATPDGRRAAIGSRDGTVRIWDLVAGRITVRLPGHTSAVGAVALSPDGRRVLSGAEQETLLPPPLLGPSETVPATTARGDGTVRLWDVATGRELARLSGHQGTINSVTFSPDGRKALSAGADRTTRLWDLDTGKEVRRFVEKRPQAIVRAVFSPDGKRLLTSSVISDFQSPHSDVDVEEEFALRLWDVATGKELRSYRGHTWPTASMAFSPDGRRILSGSYDGTVRVSDVESGETLAAFEWDADYVSCVAFTPDGRRALSTCNNNLRVWSLQK